MQIIQSFSSSKTIMCREFASKVDSRSKSGISFPMDFILELKTDVDNWVTIFMRFGELKLN